MKNSLRFLAACGILLSAANCVKQKDQSPSMDAELQSIVNFREGLALGLNDTKVTLQAATKTSPEVVLTRQLFELCKLEPDGAINRKNCQTPFVDVDEKTQEESPAYVVSLQNSGDVVAKLIYRGWIKPAIVSFGVTTFIFISARKLAASSLSKELVKDIVSELSSSRMGKATQFLGMFGLSSVAVSIGDGMTKTLMGGQDRNVFDNLEDIYSKDDFKKMKSVDGVKAILPVLANTLGFKLNRWGQMLAYSNSEPSPIQPQTKPTEGGNNGNNK